MVIKNAKFKFSKKLWGDTNKLSDFTAEEIYNINISPSNTINSITVGKVNENDRFCYTSLDDFLLNWEF